MSPFLKTPYFWVSVIDSNFIFLSFWIEYTVRKFEYVEVQKGNTQIYLAWFAKNHEKSKNRFLKRQLIIFNQSIKLRGMFFFIFVKQFTKGWPTRAYLAWIHGHMCVSLHLLWSVIDRMYDWCRLLHIEAAN